MKVFAKSILNSLVSLELSVDDSTRGLVIGDSKV